MKPVRFIQFVRPRGRKRSIEIDRPVLIHEMYLDLIESGYRFEAEVLTTGAVHMDITHPDDEIPIANLVSENGPGLTAELDKMIKRAFQRGIDNGRLLVRVT